MDIRGKQIISSWEMVVYVDCVSFKRVDNGRMQESYPPVPTAKAAVYVAAIVNGLEPPRVIRACDKIYDHDAHIRPLGLEFHCPVCGALATNAWLEVMNLASFCLGCGQRRLRDFKAVTVPSEMPSATPAG
ncbi:hypothetical protein PS870_06429 [Pseudomonas fluorescens]|uniref:Uncharacterized protein n=1 Tax=Pseudomonas fluorescens TaxID=294 RepID=A0A5E7QJT6_PSEFL|nr:hypothetical protein PS870_06429 [Pseudomonas fluorescens]